LPQNTLFPTRQGLSLPRGEMLQATEVLCEGGLDLSQSILEVNPGFAIELVNFEPSHTGGYRRISGFSLASSDVVPGQGQILGAFVHPLGYFLAARQDASDPTKYNIYSGGGTSWTQINPSSSSQTGNVTNGSSTISALSIGTTNLTVGQTVSGAGIPAGTRILTIAGPSSITIGHLDGVAVNATLTTVGATLTFGNPLNYVSGMVLEADTYNWTGTYKIVFADGVNPAYTWDTTTFRMIYSVGAKANPSRAIAHKNYMFVLGYSSNYGAIAISEPNNEYAWTVLGGAAEIVLGDTLTGARPWRDELYVFGKKSIRKIAGNSTDISSSTPFMPKLVTDKIGCQEGRTIKEINGDLLYLAADGLRTISGTANIGDTDVGTISRSVQPIVSIINPIQTPCHAAVIGQKTQYRLFYPSPTLPESDAIGLIAAIRKFRGGSMDWEFSQLSGIKAACTDSGYWITDGQEYVIHGGYDGFVYRQESGTDFNGTPITDEYTTVPLELGDRGIRKAIQRITVYVTSEGGYPLLNMQLIYDLGNTRVIQPQPYLLTSFGGAMPAIYGTAVYGEGWLYGVHVTPLYRQDVQGSGFVLQLKFTSTDSVPYVIQGFLIEYFPAGRR